MSDITTFAERVDDEVAASFMSEIESLGLAIDDPRIEDFFARIDLVDLLYKDRAKELELAISRVLVKFPNTASISVSEIVEPLREVIKAALLQIPATSISIPDITKALEDAIGTQGLVTDYAKLTKVIDDALMTDQLIHRNKPVDREIGLYEKAILGGLLAVGLCLGGGFTALLSQTVWVPQQIEAARLQSVEDLKYLGSKEGQTFKSIVRMNSGYLDTGRCKQDASKNGYYMTRDKEKLTDVCLVLMPK